jgi:translation initiation factor IF-1
MLQPINDLAIRVSGHTISEPRGPDTPFIAQTNHRGAQVCVFVPYVAQCLSKERTASRLSKDDLIDMQGTVVAVHSGGLYRVQCDAGHEVLAQLSGRMRRFRIKVVPGDRVTVGVSPYDPVRGIITFRAR